MLFMRCIYILFFFQVLQLPKLKLFHIFRFLVYCLYCKSTYYFTYYASKFVLVVDWFFCQLLKYFIVSLTVAESHFSNVNSIQPGLFTFSFVRLIN